MMSHVYFPQLPLATFIELFWSFEGYKPPHDRERVLPTGTTTLIFHLDRATTNLYGAHSEFFTIDTAQPSSFVGVHFRPGGAFPFLGLPASEVHNAVVPLETLWGPRATEVREQVLEAPTMQKKFQTLERFLLKLLKCHTLAHPAVSFALREIQTAPSLASVTAQLGLSSRRFSQVFAQEVSLTPKLFQRVLRFQHVLHTIEKQQNIHWSELALSCDYVEKSSVNRDVFRHYQSHLDAR
jgi:AraC-like DNA-binding protein